MLILLIVAILISTLITLKLTGNNSPSRTNKTGINKEPTTEVTKAIVKDKIQKTLLRTTDGSYTVLIRKLQENEDTTLIPNFKEALGSAEVLSSNRCDFIINGGFYTKENSPLGLFFLKEKTFAGYLESNFLNGSITKNRKGDFALSSGRPSTTEGLEFALQSGPYFTLKDGIEPKFENEKARRSLIAQDSKGKIYFLAVYDSSDTFSGPDLNQLKKVLSGISDNNNLELVSAVNLDGGSTLAFLQNGEGSIPEIKKSGSFFCIKNR